MNIVFEDNVVKLYHHDTRICLDQVELTGTELKIIDYNMFAVCDENHGMRYGKVADGKIVQLDHKFICDCPKSQEYGIYFKLKCYCIVNDILLVRSPIDHTKEVEVKLGFEDMERVFWIDISDEWLCVIMLHNRKYRTRLYNLINHKRYLLDFMIYNITGGLCVYNINQLMNFKNFISNAPENICIENKVEKYFYDFKFKFKAKIFNNGYFVDDSVHYNKYYGRVIDNKVFKVEPFCELRKFLFSNDFIDNFVHVIQSSTPLVDAIIKNIIIHYWGM